MGVGQIGTAQPGALAALQAKRVFPLGSHRLDELAYGKGSFGDAAQGSLAIDPVPIATAYLFPIDRAGRLKVKEGSAVATSASGVPTYTVIAETGSRADPTAVTAIVAFDAERDEEIVMTAIYWYSTVHWESPALGGKAPVTREERNRSTVPPSKPLFF